MYDKIYKQEKKISFFRKTERWYIDHKMAEAMVNKSLIEPELNDYGYHPELFVVQNTYCT